MAHPTTRRIRSGQSTRRKSRTTFSRAVGPTTRIHSATATRGPRTTRRPSAVRKPPVARGKQMNDVTVTRGGITTRYQHFSNGKQNWVVLTRFRTNQPGKQRWVKMTTTRFRDFMKRSGEQNVRGWLAAAAMHADLFKGISEHGKGLLGTGLGDLAEIAFHLN